MKSLLYGLALLGVPYLWACNPAPESNTEGTVADSLATALPATERRCYRFAATGDTARLAIEEHHGKVSGRLSYDYAGKDSNDGHVEGHMRGDTLFADYEFQSEGTTSVREVVFLRRGDAWVEGYGPGEEVNGKFVLRKDSLDFNNELLLEPIDCLAFN